MPKSSPEAPVAKIRWSAEKRLEFIEFKAFWDGSVNRSDITQAFSVSVPQASADLSNYQSVAPSNLRYDASAKCYIASDAFRPLLTRPNAEQYLSQLVAYSRDALMPTQMWMTNPPAAETLPIPQRPVDPEILRALLRAIRTNASIEIEYHSMNKDSPTQKWRRVTPHAFGFDGFRWHSRAWCHRNNLFKDFLLSRCCAARDPGPAGTPSGEDTLWKGFLDVTLTPNPALTASQRRAVELDYGMRRGSVSVVVRLAMLYYFDKYVSPGLTNKVVSNEQARRQPLVVENAPAYCDALKRVGGIRQYG